MQTYYPEVIKDRFLAVRSVLLVLTGILLVWFLAGGCTSLPAEQSSPVVAMAAPTLQLMPPEEWSIPYEAARAAQALTETYSSLALTDAQVPPEKLGVARATRLAALLVTCRVVYESAPEPEVNLSKLIAAKMWEAYQAQLEAQQKTLYIQR